MEKKAKMDFLLRDKENERLVFRFYPKKSRCYSYGKKPPKNWDDVSEVCYSYAILRQTRLREGERWSTEKVFADEDDEFSVIYSVGTICTLLAKGRRYNKCDGKKYSLLNEWITPLGMGTEWKIKKHEWEDWCEKEGDFKKYIFFEFVLFSYWDRGFRFSIEKEKMKPFGEFLISCCEYMLAHGDPR